MKFLLYILCFFPLTMQENQSNSEWKKLPPCIRQRIEEIKKQPRWNPPAEVMEYRYKGRRVFLFSSDCCDNFNPVYDEKCNYIGAPNGGITGKGDRKCPDFFEKAKKIKTVWKDER